MKHLNFKSWMINELANYGYGYAQSDKSSILGGTEEIEGDEVFFPLKSDEIIEELFRMPPLGVYSPNKKWENEVFWGEGVGSISASVTPLGSSRVVIRRESTDLLGNSVKICKKVFPLYDVIHAENELQIANNIYTEIVKINKKMIETSNNNFNIKGLSNKLWNDLKKNHPSYIMFPTELRSINENYYKMVFEFRGHGVQNLVPGPGRSEQFHLDLFFDKQTGIIRCWGYNIDSKVRQHSWSVQPSEWDECFSPNQEEKEIIDCIKNTFIKY